MHRNNLQLCSARTARNVSPVSTTPYPEVPGEPEPRISP
jgi:hypothetical protein